MGHFTWTEKEFATNRGNVTLPVGEPTSSEGGLKAVVLPVVTDGKTAGYAAFRTDDVEVVGRQGRLEAHGDNFTEASVLTYREKGGSSLPKDGYVETVAEAKAVAEADLLQSAIFWDSFKGNSGKNRVAPEIFKQADPAALKALETHTSHRLAEFEKRGDSFEQLLEDRADRDILMANGLARETLGMEKRGYKPAVRQSESAFRGHDR